MGLVNQMSDDRAPCPACGTVEHVEEQVQYFATSSREPLVARWFLCHGCQRVWRVPTPAHESSLAVLR